MLGVQDLGSRDPNGVVRAGPWLPREGAAADAAIAIDRLTAKIERLERREEALQKQVAELVELSHQAGRFQALAESLRNSRDYKVEETARQMRDLRGRIDAIEGPKSDFAGLAFKSLTDIGRKLGELDGVESRAAAMTRRFHAATMAFRVLAVGLLCVAARSSF